MPPILPIVLYSGNTDWNYATSLHELYMPDIPAKLLKYQPNLSFFLLQQKGYYMEEELLTSDNLFAPFGGFRASERGS